jgi:hypothetical protein
MSATRESVIHCNPEIFTENFNRLPHAVQHTLSDNPLFSIPAIAELAQRVAARERPHHARGDIHIEGTAASGAQLRNDAKAHVAQLVEEIEQGQTWIILKHIEREPGYREVFENCIADLVRLAGKELLKDVKWFEAILFITSPNRVTEYHIDRECAWLLQIHGNKDMHLFDRDDKDVLPDEELERYWMGDNLSATYKPHLESRAIVHRLRPGVGVHSPVNTPHWLKNGDNVSVSLNINLQLHESAWENLFRANNYLRRAGLVPSSPGRNPLADRMKRGAYTAVQDVKRLLKGQPRVPLTEARREYNRIVQMLKAR